MNSLNTRNDDDHIWLVAIQCLIIGTVYGVALLNLFSTLLMIGLYWGKRR